MLGRKFFHMQPWSPTSWKKLPAKHQPIYEDQELLKNTLQQLNQLPHLVGLREIQELKSRIASAQQGQEFLLQGGDCAEKFEDCHIEGITSKINIMLQLSEILRRGLKKPIISVGRIAGQYAKPRSNEFERVLGENIPSFKGDSVNSFEANIRARRADPQRLLLSYQHSARSLNWIRNLSTKKFYTSHEGLLLPLESALTHQLADKNIYLNMSAHMLWLGDRTRDVDGAHVEYFRGIENPIGIKLGPSITADELLLLIDKLNPCNETGKITLITRLGEHKVQTLLPSLIQAVQSQSFKVLWSCDPMHGNLSITEHGIKTRRFDSILNEMLTTFHIHKNEGSILGGVHFELTGDNVTECIGGAEKITADDLSKHYDSYCDPRLNYHQSLEIAFEIAKNFNR